MTTASEILKEIKALFNEQAQGEGAPAPKTEETKVEFAEYSLADGTKVKIDKLEVGGMVQNADGSPAPAGSIVLADGTTIEVDDKGAILEVASAKDNEGGEGEGAPAPAPAPAGMTEEQMSSLKAELEALIGKKFTELEAKSEEFKKAQAEIENKNAEAFKLMIELAEQLAGQPKVEPTDRKSSIGGFISTSEAKLEQVNRFRKAITK